MAELMLAGQTNDEILDSLATGWRRPVNIFSNGE